MLDEVVVDLDPGVARIEGERLPAHVMEFAPGMSHAAGKTDSTSFRRVGGLRTEGDGLPDLCRKASAKLVQIERLGHEGCGLTDPLEMIHGINAIAVRACQPDPNKAASSRWRCGSFNERRVTHSTAREEPEPLLPSYPIYIPSLRT